MTRVSFITAAVVVALFTGSSPLIAQGPPQLPSQASSVAEAQFEGTLEVQIEDHAQGSIVHHFLDLPNGRLRLQVPPGFSDLDGLETGTIIRARGRLNGNTLELSSSQGSVVTMALATSNTFGEQRVIVILVNFQDNTSAPFDWTTTQMITFGDVSSFYKENSYGQTWLTGDVFGWFTLPMTSSTCDTAKISSLADQAAAKAGATLSRYTRKVYAFPQIAPCTFWGRGTVGGNPSSAWINGGYALKVVAHELGHNFGDYHSKSEPCDAGGCSLIEYGDDRDIMGQSWHRPFQCLSERTVRVAQLWFVAARTDDHVVGQLLGGEPPNTWQRAEGPQDPQVLDVIQ